MGKKLISFVAGCLNEAGNVSELYKRICTVMGPFCDNYDFEILFIDNDSTDGTQNELRMLAAKDRRVKAIFNMRNFGTTRSGSYAFRQCYGDAVIALASDLEDPPELIPEFLHKWEQGYKLALAIRTDTNETGILPFLRNLYYTLMQIFSDTTQIRGFTGFGLYDKQFVDIFRELDDPYPYMRGLIGEMGFSYAEIPFTKPIRKRGVSKERFAALFEFAMLGLVNHTKAPLRAATFLGIIMSGLSFIIGIYYLLYKLLYWNRFQAGLAPVLVALFFFIGLIFLMLGIIGEYIGLIVTHVVPRPIVVVKERINFNNESVQHREDI